MVSVSSSSCANYNFEEKVLKNAASVGFETVTENYRKHGHEYFSDQSSKITLSLSEALIIPEISTEITPFVHTMMTFCASQEEECVMDFYKLALQNHDFNDSRFDKTNSACWIIFVDTQFRNFSRENSKLAEMIINKLAIPRHPFLSQVSYVFKANEFLSDIILDIDTYLDKMAFRIFTKKLYAILTFEDAEAQILLKDLLHKIKDMQSYDPGYKWHHAFLLNVPIHYFKKLDYSYFEYHVGIESYISVISQNIYKKVVLISFWQHSIF